MGSSAMSRRARPEFLQVFRRAADPAGTMPFDRFMELALYDPQVGYYRRPDRQRVGYAGADFFTASTSGPIFGELVAAACVELLQENLASHWFVEIGAETEGGIMAGVAHGFAGVRTVRLGEPLEISGRCVVFSNELFDAQPFQRFVFRDGGWKEVHVALRDEDLLEFECPATAVPVQFPPTAPEGYRIDAPLAAARLAGAIAAQPWNGLFVAADYGKSWRELVEAAPGGTARAYHHHTQSNDLLASPGEQDLTCHVCWEWLTESLVGHGFREVAVESQEAFFIRRAGTLISRIAAEDAARFSKRKLALAQLLHPAHLGQKFQFLHGRR